MTMQYDTSTWEGQAAFAQMLGFSHYRVSDHFLLLDFMWPAHSIYGKGQKCVPDLSAIFTAERLSEAFALANDTLEPLMRAFGPLSIAAAFDPNGNRSTPHRFDRQNGAAVDITMHDYCRPSEEFAPEGRSPITLARDMHEQGIPFSRFISYAGSEFICLSHRTAGNHGRVYENIRIGSYDPATDTPQSMQKPAFVTHSTSPRNLSDMNIRHRPDWRRVEGEPIFHTLRSLRPQHIRTGPYHVLSDFMRSEIALVNGIANSIPITAKDQVEVARMFSMVLSPIVRGLGRVSIVRGAESMALSNLQRARGCTHADKHRWADHRAGPHRLVFVPKHGTEPEDLDGFFESTAAFNPISSVEFGNLRNGDITVAVEITPFDVREFYGEPHAHLLTSAKTDCFR